MDNKKNKDLKTTSFGEELRNKKTLSIDQQKKLLSLLKMRKNFAPGAFLAKRIKKSIANFKTIKNIDKDEK